MCIRSIYLFWVVVFTCRFSNVPPVVTLEVPKVSSNLRKNTFLDDVLEDSSPESARNHALDLRRPNWLRLVG